MYRDIILPDNSHHHSLVPFRSTAAALLSLLFQFTLSRGPGIVVLFTAGNIRFLFAMFKEGKGSLFHRLAAVH
jgi:hypothetical protein